MKKELETKSLIGQEGIAREWASITAQIKALEEQIKILKRQKEPIERHFMDSMGSADVGVMNGFSVEWKKYETKRFDTKRFKEEHANLYEEYMSANPASRFTIKATAMAPAVEEDESFDF